MRYETKIFSNNPRVSNPVAVQRICDGYHTTWLEVKVENGRLIFQGDAEEDDMTKALPLAWLGPLPDEEDDEEFDYDEWPPMALYEELGEKGFQRLLSEIGPFLLEPLVVVNKASYSSWRDIAPSFAFRVKPGRRKVRKIKDTHPDWEAIVAPAMKSKANTA